MAPPVLVHAFQAAHKHVCTEDKWTNDRGPIANALRWVKFAGWEIAGPTKFFDDLGCEVNILSGPPVLASKTLVSSLRRKFFSIDTSDVCLRAGTPSFVPWSDPIKRFGKSKNILRISSG